MERKLNDDALEKNPVDSAPNTTISKSNDIMTNSAGIHQSSSEENLACPSSNSSRQVHILTIKLTISPSCCNLLHVMFRFPIVYVVSNVIYFFNELQKI